MLFLCVLRAWVVVFIAFGFSGVRAQGCGFGGCLCFRLEASGLGLRVWVRGLSRFGLLRRRRGSQAKRAHVEASALHCSPKKALTVPWALSPETGESLPCGSRNLYHQQGSPMNSISRLGVST